MNQTRGEISTDRLEPAEEIKGSNLPDHWTTLPGWI